MKTVSSALWRWQVAHNNAIEAKRADEVGVGFCYDDVDRTTAERDRLYALLTPADKAAADRIAKETTP